MGFKRLFLSEMMFQLQTKYVVAYFYYGVSKLQHNFRNKFKQRF
jgi:hypothetical protein